MNWTMVTTSAEVWAVIKAAHPDLKVHTSYSYPDGDQFGNHDQCGMRTEYGFDGAPIPLIGAHTRWEKGEKEYERINEKTNYWLCIALEEGEN